MGIRVTPIANEARLFEWHGVRIWVKYLASGTPLRSRRMVLTAQDGLSEEEYDQLSQYQKNQYLARAMVGDLIETIEPFKVTFENEKGETETVEFKTMDDPSDMDGYETLAEELIGEDDHLRDALLERAVTASYYQERREVELLGN